MTERRVLSLYGADPRSIPTYTPWDAAHLVHVPPSTMRSWVYGRKYPTGRGGAVFQPVIELPPENPGRRLSFTNLVEAHVLSSIRSVHGVSLDKVRRAVTYVRDRLGVQHPLASGRFKTDGASLFVSELCMLINASDDGQLAMRELLDHVLVRIDIDEDSFATRLYPSLRHFAGGPDPKLISIDPRVAFGRPVVAGTNIPTAILHDRWMGGDSRDELAEDYGLDPTVVEEVLRFEARDAA